MAGQRPSDIGGRTRFGAGRDPAAAWREQADALWKAPAFDHAGAARLVAELVQEVSDPDLADSARQALPSLRHAATREAETFRRAIARRRFGLVRDLMHQLGRPPFGRRAGPACAEAVRDLPDTIQPDSAELRHRAALGLPARRRLAEPEIQAAYRRAAKAIHPDRGGTSDAFIDLTASRDALLGRG